MRIPQHTPAFETRRGQVYEGDALEILRSMPDSSVNLVITSPPYALEFKKEYGNESQAEYVSWFLPFAHEVRRVLTDDGSFVVNIGGAWRKGHPVRSLYRFRLLIALVDDVGLHLAQEVYWYNPAKMPTPAEWVNVQRIRVKDSVEPCWWMSKTERPKASNRNVLVPYSVDMIRLIERGFRPMKRPSGHLAKATFQKDHGGAIPGNVLTLKFLTDPGDTVLDIFGGSMTTGWAAERAGRNWIGIEIVPQYVAASRLRFFDDEGALLPDEYRTQPPLVPVIDLSPDDGGVDADLPVLNRTEVRPAG